MPSPAISAVGTHPGEQTLRPVGYLRRFRRLFGYACQVVYTHSKIANQDSQCGPIPGLGLSVLCSALGSYHDGSILYDLGSMARGDLQAL